jgi:hypothetical protein
MASSLCLLVIWAATKVVALDSCAGTVIVHDADAFRIGDRVMLYQAWGSTVSNAGRWCLADVRDISGSMMTLNGPLSIALDATMGVQVVLVQTGAHLVLDHEFVVPPMRDGVGGVVMFDADTITLAANILARGVGHAGGDRSLNCLDTSVVDGDIIERNGRSAEKGHSIVSPLSDLASYGRARSLNGGGGGNARNAGGGGGAGGGAGGSGGNQTSEFTALVVGGDGGEPLPADQFLHQIWLGGGGGGGHQNDLVGGNGGAGGGIVILRCSVLLARNARIDVSGADGGSAIVDGAGGGGGAGTVVIQCDTLTGVLNVVARGGSGGRTLGIPRCYGPGGGGGGGIVVLNRHHVGVSIDVAGGSNGTTASVDAPCANDPSYGAKEGEPGMVIVGLVPEFQHGLPCRPPDVLVRTVSVSATAGEMVDVVVEFEPQAPFTTEQDVHARIRTRATVLFPIGPYWWAGRRQTLRIVNATIPASSVDIVTRTLRFQCALGDSADIQLTIDSVWADRRSTEIGIDREGRFVLSDVCRSGIMPRLFDPFASTPPVVDVYDLQGRKLGQIPSVTDVSGYEGRSLLFRPLSRSRGSDP